MSEMTQSNTAGRSSNANARNRSTRISKVTRWNFATRSNSGQVRYYIASLHRRIRNLMERCRKYRGKIVKLERAFRGKKQAAITNDKSAPNAPPTESKPKDPPMSADSFIDDIKSAALDAQNLTGFIYEPTSGLYYDSRTGYYYNAEHGLYYDGDRGCYYSYNQADNKFEFHSQVFASDGSTSAETKQNDALVATSKVKRKCSDAKHKAAAEQKADRGKRELDGESKEDGELSDDDNDSDDDVADADAIENHDDDEPDDEEKDTPVIGSVIKSPARLYGSYHDTDDDNSSSAYSESDMAKYYPPSLRIIVQETNVKKLKLGELFLITYKGGSLGREGDHDVIIPDLVCSKFHLTFTYDIKLQSYTCVDLGSRNGTILNGQRMSNSKQESEALKLDHGSILQIGQTKLLCHVHDGSVTCGQCEPGLVQHDCSAASSHEVSVTSHAQQHSAQGTHKQQLKELKKRYGLQNNTYETVKMNPKNDRAEHRRQKVGSSCEYEKTRTASLNTSIASDNKGFKMLSKLGWSEGQSLGKNPDGILEPIAMESNPGQKGLGCAKTPSTVSYSQNAKLDRKSKILKKTSERYRASQITDIFEDCSGEND